MLPAPWLVELERSLAEDEGTDALATAVVVLASLAGRDIAIPQAVLRAATRRALLLLAAGGDPARGLDLNGRAVTSLAEEIRDTDRQLALENGVRELHLQTTGLPHVSEAVHGLMQTPDVAWKAYAAALLAEELGGDD